MQQSTDPVTHDELRAIALRKRPWTRQCGKRLAHAAHAGGVLDTLSDVCWALELATRIYAHHGDISTALELADKWVRASEIGLSDGSARAQRGRLLCRSGRVEDALDDFEVARQHLTSSPGASWFLTHALEDCGRADLAGQWLTDALVSILHGPPRPEVDPDRRELLISRLAFQRCMLRQRLDLPADDFDELADRSDEPAGAWLAAARRRESVTTAEDAMSR